MADTHQSFRQHMHQEAADKLVTMQRHDFRLVVFVVFIAEPDLIFLQVDESLVTDRNPVAITCEVCDDAIGMIEAMFAIHHPVFLHQLVEYPIDFIGIGDATELADFGA